jgi:hypothetical protein
MDQPNVKYLAEQISPNGTKYNRQTMEKHKAAVMSSHLQTFEYNHQPQKYISMFPHTPPVTIEHLNTTVNSKESPKIYIHVPPYTTCYHRTLEYNRQLQGVSKYIYPFSPIHHLLPSNTYSSLCHLKLSPFGPISLLPLVQSLPIGNTCPEDIQRRLTPQPSDLLRHPEQMSRVVDGTGHIGEMRRVRLQEEPVPWYGFEPPSLSVAKPLHHTREPKVGSRPEFDCGLIPIETMEMNTLQGIGDFVQRQAQYLPV